MPARNTPVCARSSTHTHGRTVVCMSYGGSRPAKVLQKAENPREGTVPRSTHGFSTPAPKARTPRPRGRRACCMRQHVQSAAARAGYQALRKHIAYEWRTFLTRPVGLPDRLSRVLALFSNAVRDPVCPRVMLSLLGGGRRQAASLCPETPDTCVGAEPTGADRHRLRPWETPIRACS